MSGSSRSSNGQQAASTARHELQYVVEFQSHYSNDLTAWFNTTITVPAGTTTAAIEEQVREHIVDHVADRTPADLELAYLECTGVILAAAAAERLACDDGRLKFTTEVAYEADGVPCEGYVFDADVQDDIVYLQILASVIDGAEPIEQTIHEVPITDVTHLLDTQHAA